MRLLVAGFGNVLRRDDGFGVRLLRRLELSGELPDGVTTLEAGIGGVSLVQELLEDYAALILLDALEGERPGEVEVLALEVADLAALGVNAAREHLADVHFAEPGRALALAKAIGKLPAVSYLVGCVAGSCELGEGLTEPVERALEVATGRTLELIDRLRVAAGAGRERSVTWSR